MQTSTKTTLKFDALRERFFDDLVTGDRVGARNTVRHALREGASIDTLLNSVCFPVYERIEMEFRNDQLNNVQYHLATRLLRMLVDQAAAGLPQAACNGKTIFAVCGESQSEELAAQLTVDLLEAAGCTVHFCGGGIPADEVLAQVHTRRPDVLLIFAAAAKDLPGIREMIDRIREIGASDRTKIVVGGGVFNRAEGLADEIHCDLWAITPLETVATVLTGQMQRERTTPGAIARIGGKTKPQRKAA
jgi:MerR family transcriptional regulator, light-induced transcriptional regulator